jgi:hypothetical protein
MPTIDVDVVLVVVTIEVVDVGVDVVVDELQDANNIAVTISKLKLNQITLFFNFILHFYTYFFYFLMIFFLPTHSDIIFFAPILINHH